MVRGIDSFRDWFQGYEDQYAMAYRPDSDDPGRDAGGFDYAGRSMSKPPWRMKSRRNLSARVLTRGRGIGTKHLIVSRLIERMDVRTGYKVHIKFKILLKQFLGQE